YTAPGAIPTPTPTPTPDQSPTPTPTPTPTPSPTPTPDQSPTPTPTPTPDQSPTPTPSDGVAGRLALSCDGNFHDHDDINSSAWELAMCAKAGRGADLVYFDYADHYWENDPTMESQITTSVMTAVNDWGYSPNIIHNAHADPTGAVNALSAAINVSTVNNPLTIMEAGPAEIIGRALALSKGTNPNALKFVTVISHSSWNNTHAAQVGPSEGLTDITYSFSDFGTSGKALGANTLQLVFQQQLNDGPYSQ